MVFTPIFDGNYKFLLSIDLEKFYGQLIKNFEMVGVSGNPKNLPKTTPLYFHGNLYHMKYHVSQSFSFTHHNHSVLILSVLIVYEQLKVSTEASTK